MRKQINLKQRFKKDGGGPCRFGDCYRKVKDSINELNQKGRERLIDAFDKS